MAKLISWLLVNVSPRQCRRLLVGMLVGELAAVACLFALIGMPNLALYIFAAALVALYIGTWRERLLHSN